MILGVAFPNWLLSEIDNVDWSTEHLVSSLALCLLLDSLVRTLPSALYDSSRKGTSVQA